MKGEIFILIRTETGIIYNNTTATEHTKEE